MKNKYSILMPLEKGNEENSFSFLEAKLTKLGFDKFAKMEFPTHIKLYHDGTFSALPHNSAGNDVALNKYNPEAFLAIAAIRKDEDYHVGEHIIYVNDAYAVPVVFYTGEITKIDSIVKEKRAYGTLEKWYYHSIPYAEKSSSFSESSRAKNIYTRKATPQEIIEFYKNKKSNMKDIKVSGNKHLLVAFANSLIEEGIFYSPHTHRPYTSVFTIESASIMDKLRISERKDVFAFTGGLKNGIPDYVLPQDWDKALEAFLKAKEEFEKSKEITARVRYDGGELEFTIRADGMCNKEVGTISNLTLGFHLKNLPASWETYKVNIEKIDIGCKKGVVIQDLKDMLELHRKTFGK